MKVLRHNYSLHMWHKCWNMQVQVQKASRSRQWDITLWCSICFATWLALWSWKTFTELLKEQVSCERPARSLKAILYYTSIMPENVRSCLYISTYQLPHVLCLLVNTEKDNTEKVTAFIQGKQTHMPGRLRSLQNLVFKILIESRSRGLFSFRMMANRTASGNSWMANSGLCGLFCMEKYSDTGNHRRCGLVLSNISIIWSCFANIL